MRVSCLYPLVLTAVALPAQILGLERGAPVKLDHIATSDCKRTANCNLPTPPLDAHAAPLGGAVYDSVLGKIYTSDGRDIVLTNISCVETCRAPIPASYPAITGLGYNKFRSYLYSSHTDRKIRIWPGGSCPTSPLGECTINLPTGTDETITGIEFDGRVAAGYPNGRLFVLTNIGRLVIVHEPRPGSCGEICRTMLPTCAPAFATLQGLTYDPGRRYLYATDGKRLAVVKESGVCQLALVKCCDISSVDAALSGLAFRSGVNPGAVGLPCTDARCLGCLPGIFGFGAPSTLNPGFGFDLANLPVNGPTALFMTYGPPSPGIPLFCGKIWIDPASPLVLTFPVPVSGGSTPCSGKGKVPLGMFPPITAGLQFTVQAACVCNGGLALSQGMTFEIGG